MVTELALRRQRDPRQLEGAIFTWSLSGNTKKVLRDVQPQVLFQTVFTVSEVTRLWYNNLST